MMNEELKTKTKRKNHIISNIMFLEKFARCNALRLRRYVQHHKFLIHHSSFITKKRAENIPPLQ